jgi:putative toxin-antitoxin system antitoxin component (TIGR02293 family)
MSYFIAQENNAMVRATAERHPPETPRRPAPLPYVEIYRAAPVDRIRLIKDGVPAAKAKAMIADLQFDQQVLLAALHLSTATVNRKAARGEPLAPDESERVIGLARLVGQLQAMVEESGDPEGFDALGWLSAWLREPLPALGGSRPIDLLDTMEGQALLARTLGQMQSGSYA